MSTWVDQAYAKRFLLAIAMVCVLAGLFWTQSRYPSLNDKALMSGAIQLEDPISFEAEFPILEEYSVGRKIYYSTLNWISTNRAGMTFGILFGAAFLTLFGYLRQRSFKGSFANSFLGLFVGAPLGVCVNCAAPIAKGLYSGGTRAETTLSAMVASPTLNIVVLTMLFSIFPLYLALMKVALSFVVILLAVPIICRFLPKAQLQIAEAERIASRYAPPMPRLPKLTATGRESATGAAMCFVRDYFSNLWFIVKMTLPLMLLAGFLGAVVATLVPSSLLADTRFGAVAAVLTAIVGTFMPVPIGFDVVTTGALMNGGLNTGFVMVLLFTLGIFSVYSFFIVAQAISLRAAGLMAGVVMLLGVLGGFGAHAYHEWRTNQALEILTGFNLSIVGSAQAAEADIAYTAQEGGAVIEVERLPFAERVGDDAPFTRMEAWEVGIDRPLEFTMADMWPPFWEGRSVSSGDYDNDGDIDIVMASTEAGLYFYANDGAGSFEEQSFPIGALAEMPVFNAALVDIDDDGWLDLFLTTYKGGNFIMPNDRGSFDASAMTPVANRDDALLTLALAFGDLDKDGDLDVALGNWAAGWYREIPGEEARNRLVFNQDGMLTGEPFQDLPAPPGETLSILFSDMNLDGSLDLLVGNDFGIADAFYLGDGEGGLTAITRGDGVIPHTTTTTMSVKTADLRNDGGFEIYLAQIAGRSSGVSDTLKMRSLDRYCDGIKREADLAACEQNMQIKRWYKSGHSFDPTYAARCERLEGRYQDECKGMLVKDLAIQRGDPSVCRLIPVSQPRARDLCEIHFQPARAMTAQERDDAIIQVLRSNVLLSPTAGGIYEDRAEEAGLELGGWSWDVKIADVDNDGWQDVYVVNGTWVPNEVSPSNLFFHNTGDGEFEEASGPFGLEDYLMTAAATAFDMEGDGDVDFLTMTVNGPPALFVNNSSEGNVIAFDLRDGVGNHFGVGARVEIEAGGRTQMREIQLGGGFMSFDAPVAHFGLGDTDSVDRVTVFWPEGGETVIDQTLTSGALYRISRAPEA